MMILAHCGPPRGAAHAGSKNRPLRTKPPAASRMARGTIELIATAGLRFRVAETPVSTDVGGRCHLVPFSARTRTRVHPSSMSAYCRSVRQLLGSIDPRRSMVEATVPIARRILNMPPKPHDQMKLGARKKSDPLKMDSKRGQLKNDRGKSRHGGDSS